MAKENRVRAMSERKLKRIIPYVVISILAISLLYAAVEISALNDKLNLNMSETWIDEEITLNSHSERHFDFNPSYAGYLIIDSGDLSTSVMIYVSYTYEGIDHSFKTNAYTKIPVLPTEIRIGASNSGENSVTGSLNVTYIY